MHTLQKLLAKNMKKYRLQHKLTQYQLAEKCELSQNYLQSIETARKFPSVDVLERIAKELDIQAYQLFEVREALKEELEAELQKTLSNLFDSF